MKETMVAQIENTGVNTLEHNITRFAQILRRLGVRVSLAETMDALAALTRVDLMDRSQVKGALRACLAKSRKESGIFDEAFNLFFATPEEKSRRQQMYREEEAERQRVMNSAEQDLLGVVEEWQQDLPEKIVFSEQQLETFSRMPDSQKERLMELLERMKSNPVNNPGELINQVLLSSLNYWRYYMMKNQSEKGGITPELEARLTGNEELDDVIRGVVAQFYHHPGDRILHRDLETLEDSDLPRITALISQMSSRLALGISRRYKRSARAVAVDIRRTVRRNIRYGGIPIELRYRSRRRKRPQFLLICDVSASMARHARFVLQFIYGLNSAFSSLETFIFSEDLERVTQYFSRGKGFADSMAEMINESGQWGKSTNFYTALQTFNLEHGGRLNRDTLVFIVSDTVTVAPENAAGLLRDFKKRCADVIWLNTLPYREWAEKPQVILFGEVVQMYPCNTLSQLERALHRHLLG